MTMRGYRAMWLTLALALGGCAARQPGCTTFDTASRVLGDGRCLVIKTFEPNAPAVHPVLYVVVHGDGSDFGPSVYHYKVAAALAGAGPPGAVAVALIRPGYHDGAGHRSDGSNNGRRDSYTPQNIAIMADAIRTLKRRFAASRVVGVGHSGGAAILGVIIGKYPHLLDGAVLVGCPCDVSRWCGATGHAWTASDSPSNFVADVPVDTAVTLLTGTADTNTFPGLARDYAASLVRRGIDATFVPVPRASHNGSFRSPLVITAATRLATR